MRLASLLTGILLAQAVWVCSAAPCYSPHEVTFTATGDYTNPYVQVSAIAEFRHPGQPGVRRLSLFWEGQKLWKLRFSPDLPGEWRWRVVSSDPGLDGQTGTVQATASTNRGSIRPMGGFPNHFETQNGQPFWFLGDTAWALFTDSETEKHNFEAAGAYLQRRAKGGFNVVHSMLLSEAGWGNSGGVPFDNLRAERINPGYWQEVDRRVALANRQGVICGLALAWGDKQRKEPYAWSRFPSNEARDRYARYIAARYGAYDVYFLVAGEWHAEIRARSSNEETIRQEFIRLGNVLKHADPHQRMIGIHPMTSHGSVREFASAEWMSFGDYQQNYDDLHARVLLSRPNRGPLINSEYGYFLRDQNGDGVPDKDNSTSLESMRNATWDIAMAGGYVVTGFGTTYFGGHRDPGPFNLTAEKNRAWEDQIAHLKRFFERMEWWKLEAHDEWLTCKQPRSKDARQLGQAAPPETTYWCLANPGEQIVVYGRSLQTDVLLKLPPQEVYEARRFSPRTGEIQDARVTRTAEGLTYRPEDRQDWVLWLTRTR